MADGAAQRQVLAAGRVVQLVQLGLQAGDGHAFQLPLVLQLFLALAHTLPLLLPLVPHFAQRIVEHLQLAHDPLPLAVEPGDADKVQHDTQPARQPADLLVQLLQPGLL